MKAVREWASFLWQWYVVRTWNYYFPGKSQSEPGDDAT
jgi:hypothetical protein